MSLHTVSPSNALQEYLVHRRLSGHRPYSIESCERVVGDFLNVADVPAVSEFTVPIVRAWLASLVARGLKPSSIWTYQRDVFVWLRWLHAEEYLAADLTARIPRYTVRDSSITRRVATPDMRAKLITVVRNYREFPHRNVALIELMWSTGIRRGEIPHLQLDGLDTRTQSLVVPESKTGMARTIAVGGGALIAIQRYLNRERGRQPGALFLGSR